MSEDQEAAEPAPAASPASGRGSPFAAVRGLAGLTLVSRLLGFVRDVLMATALGTGLAADAFFLAWMIPNLFRRLFGEGAFATALVPVFVERREAGDREGAHRLVSAAACRLFLGLTAAVIVLELVFTAVLSAPGQDALESLGVAPAGLHKLSLALDLARLLLPYLVLICVAGLLGGALNAEGQFAIPAAAPVAFNLVWIAALLVSAQLTGEPLGRVRLLALALLGGGVLQLLMHTRAMAAAGLPIQPIVRADPALMARVRRLFASLALGMALFQLNVLLDGVIAYSLVPEGGVSALYYANRLVQLPIGVLGVALSTAVFPELARRVKRGDTAGLGQVLDAGLALGAFVSVPAAVGLAVLAEPIVRTLFERGEFDPVSTHRTGRVLLLLAPAVVAACTTPIITRAFYAEEEVHTPVRVGAACVALNLVLNLLLVGPLQEAGLALATTISQTVNLLAQAVLYRRRRVARGDPPATARTWRALGAAVGLAALMGVGAAATHAVLPEVPDAVRLIAAVGVGVVIYAGAARLLRVRELSLLLARRVNPA